MTAAKGKISKSKKGKSAKGKTTRRKERESTEKEENFCLYYTGKSKFNATDAAKLAGYTGSEGTIRVTAHNLLTKPNIKKRIIELTEQRFKDAGYSIDRTTKEIMDIAFYDPADFFDVDENGYLKFKTNIQDIKKAFPTNAISEISTSTIKRSTLQNKNGESLVETWVTKLKFHDKKWALEMLSKLLEMKSGDNTLKVTFADFIKKFYKEDETIET